MSSRIWRLAWRGEGWAVRNLENLRDGQFAIRQSCWPRPHRDCGGAPNRRDGIASVSVADLMSEAGPTRWRVLQALQVADDLIAAAVDAALSHGSTNSRGGRAWRPHRLTAIIDGYLSQLHRDEPESGCAVAGGINAAAGLSYPVAAVQVDVDDLAELLGRCRGRYRRPLHCVVDQDVDMSELRDRCLDSTARALSGRAASAAAAIARPRPARQSRGSPRDAPHGRPASTRSAPAPAAPCRMPRPGPGGPGSRSRLFLVIEAEAARHRWSCLSFWSQRAAALSRSLRLGAGG